jgi:hypothetical protein
MKNKMMMAQGYQITTERELKNAVNDFNRNHPNFIHDGISVKDIVKLYRKRTKPYRHIVFINTEGNWFIQFLTDEEVLYRTNQD